MEATTEKLDQWDRLMSEQTELFRQIKAENEELRAKQKMYETDLKVWRGAVDQAEEKTTAMQRSVAKMQREISFVKDHPLILCLIDGDGNIFTQDLIQLGRPGGHQAAGLLSKGINDYLISTQDGLAGRGQLWITVYMNKRGLAETLAATGHCTLDEFDEFVIGFNQSSPLFSIVDVGNGKEAADAKIKETFRVFTRFPQIPRIFFGGAHDNGYTTALTQLQTEGLLSKVTLLRGYSDIARELQNLNLPIADIKDVFLKQKIVMHPGVLKKAGATHSTPNVKAAAAAAAEAERVRTTSAKAIFNSPGKANNVPKNATLAPDKHLKQLNPRIPMSKHNPPPCNYYYLAKCSAGATCRYGHDYELNQAQLAELAVNSRKTPCPQINKNKPCSIGDRCIHGHVCPKGSKCPFLSKGTCKFKGKDMHSSSATSKAYEPSPKKKKHQRTPSSDESEMHDSGPSGSVMSSPGGPYDSNLPEFQWDDGVVNDISPPTSPPNVAGNHASPALNQPLFSLGPSWAFPNFGPSFTSHY